MTLRGPLPWLFATGMLGWPVGSWAFGGFHSATGALIIGVGSSLGISCVALELALRMRDRRRHGRF
jgi:hypothetical protein